MTFELIENIVNCERLQVVVITAKNRREQGPGPESGSGSGRQKTDTQGRMTGYPMLLTDFSSFVMHFNSLYELLRRILRFTSCQYF